MLPWKEGEDIAAVKMDLSGFVDWFCWLFMEKLMDARLLVNFVETG